MARIEPNLINAALEHTNDVVGHTAQLLGLQRTKRVEELRKYGIEREAA